MPNDDETHEEESVEDRVARLVDERLSAERDKADRKKRLEKMGLTDDILGAFADAVWDRGEARASARRQKEEDADQEPSRTKPKSWFERTFVGDEEAG